MKFARKLRAGEEATTRGLALDAILPREVAFSATLKLPSSGQISFRPSFPGWPGSPTQSQCTTAYVGGEEIGRNHDLAGGWCGQGGKLLQSCS